MKKKEWTDSLREKLYQYEEEPPKELWDAIEEQLHEGPKSTSRILFPTWSKALLTAAAITVIVLLVTQRYYRQSEIILNTEHSEIALLDTLDQTDKATSIESLDNHPTQVLNNKSEITVNKNTRHVHEKESISVTDSTDTISIITSDSMDNENSTRDFDQEKEQERINIKDNKRIDPTPTEPTPASPIQRLKVKKNIDKFSLNIFAVNAATHQESQLGYGRDYVQMASSAPIDEEQNESYVAKREVDFFNQNKEIKKETIHDLPVTIGITGTYNISNKLAIEGGLMYTYLSSRTKQGTSDNYQEIRRHQHFIGLPLGIKYNFWHRHNLDLYGSLGGAIERSISATSSSRYIIDNKTITTYHHADDPNYYIWSLRGSLGVRYNVYSNIGLYLEPGVSYHFTHSGMPESLYTEAPLKFSLSLGLNFRF